MQRQIANALKQLDDLAMYEFDEVIASEVRSLISTLERQAAKAGLPDLVARLQVRSPMIGIGAARRLFAECQSMLPDGPLTVAQAASRLNVAPRTVYKLIADGLLHASKRPIRITPVDLAKYQQRGNLRPGLKHLR